MRLLNPLSPPILAPNQRSNFRPLSLPAAYPRDRADRIIRATVLVEGIPLITADREIRKSRELPPIWRDHPLISFKRCTAHALSFTDWLA
jgi:hypothetical protein